MTVEFKDDNLLVAGLTLPAALVPYGQVKLFEAVKQLNHAQLEQVAAAVGVEFHPGLSSWDLMLTVASKLQLRWFTRVNPKEIPANVKNNHEARQRVHAALVETLKKGGPTVANKKSSGKKAGRPAKAEAKPLCYKLFTSKVEEDKKLKQYLDPKNESKRHDGVIIQALAGAKPGERWSLEQVAAAVKATGRYTTGDELAKSVRWHLAKLEKEGLVSAAEV